MAVFLDFKFVEGWDAPLCSPFMSKSETETTASGAHSLQEYKCPDICELLTHHSLIQADPLQVLN